MTTLSDRGGRLLLVIPAVIQYRGAALEIDGDFANNLRGYLKAFDEVCVMCPPLTPPYVFPNVCSQAGIEGADRLRIIVLPLPYREDRYLYNRSKVSELLRGELERADYVLLSPHAGLDWSSRAAELCLKAGKSYNMEADWNLPEVTLYEWRQMRPGVNKIRKWLWRILFIRQYNRLLRKSTLSLLQGGDIYHDYCRIAPNAFSVLNVQVTADDHVDAESLQKKVSRIGSRPFQLVYTGRATDQKGVRQWVDVITQLRDAGCSFHATWAGGGDRMEEARAQIVERGLSGVCEFVGTVSRHQAHALVKEADIFLFCHMTKESPRCLVEALAFGTPIVGFGTNYSRELTEPAGGGVFVEIGDVAALVDAVRSLFADPEALKALIERAAVSGRALDRDAAIEHRIGLMKRYLKNPVHQAASGAVAST